MVVLNIRKDKFGRQLPLSNFRFNAALWLRVRDKDDYVVDMVPACVDDDKIQNPKMAGNGQWNVAFRPELGQAFPLMLLDTVAGEGRAWLQLRWLRLVT